MNVLAQQLQPPIFEILRQTVMHTLDLTNRSGFSVQKLVIQSIVCKSTTSQFVEIACVHACVRVRVYVACMNTRTDFQPFSLRPIF